MTLLFIAKTDGGSKTLGGSHVGQDGAKAPRRQVWELGLSWDRSVPGRALHCGGQPSGWVAMIAASSAPLSCSGPQGSDGVWAAGGTVGSRRGGRRALSGPHWHRAGITDCSAAAPAPPRALCLCCPWPRSPGRGRPTLPPRHRTGTQGCHCHPASGPPTSTTAGQPCSQPTTSASPAQGGG